MFIAIEPGSPMSINGLVFALNVPAGQWHMVKAQESNFVQLVCTNHDLIVMR